jgi:hypothetical protein
MNLAAAIKVAGISQITCATRFKYNASIATQRTVIEISLIQILHCAVISHQFLLHRVSALPIPT